MNTIKIGLVPSPDLPEKIVSQIIGQLKNSVEKHVDQHVDWQIEMEVDPFTGAAEYVNECVDKAVRLKKARNWHYAICITDLPSFSQHKAVIADVSSQRGAALLSLPSFGAFPLRRRIVKAVTFIVELLHNHGREDNKEDEISHINWRFLFSRIKRVVPEESNNTDTRFILSSSIIGWMRVLSGMTFANRPWMALASFKQILTLAFATGTYISIFSLPWQLSVNYSIPRFMMLMGLSIIGMVTWIIFAHHLWEKASSKSQSQYRILYNITTVMTLMVITIINYAVLYVLFTFSILLFVPEGIFNSWTQGNTDDSLESFMRLAWLITSLGVLAGSVGATVEKEEKIRHVTYSYRQRNRYYEIEQQRKQENRNDSKESYAGTRQTHRESNTQ